MRRLTGLRLSVALVCLITLLALLWILHLVLEDRDWLGAAAVTAGAFLACHAFLTLTRERR